MSWWRPRRLRKKAPEPEVLGRVTSMTVVDGHLEAVGEWIELPLEPGWTTPRPNPSSETTDHTIDSLKYLLGQDLPSEEEMRAHPFWNLYEMTKPGGYVVCDDIYLEEEPDRRCTLPYGHTGAHHIREAGYDLYWDEVPSAATPQG